MAKRLKFGPEAVGRTFSGELLGLDQEAVTDETAEARR